MGEQLVDCHFVVLDKRLFEKSNARNELVDFSVNNLLLDGFGLFVFGHLGEGDFAFFFDKFRGNFFALYANWRCCCNVHAEVAHKRAEIFVLSDEVGFASNFYENADLVV